MRLCPVARLGNLVPLNGETREVATLDPGRLL